MKKIFFMLLCFGNALNLTGASAEKTLAAYKQSYSYEISKEYAKAVKVLYPLLKIRSRDYTLNMRLGWLYYSAGKYDNAFKYYKTAIKASPYSAEAKLGATLPLLALGKYKEVESITTKIRKTDPDNYYGNLRLAYALRMQKKYSATIKVADKMLKLYPLDTSFLTEHALAALAQGNVAETKKVIYQILKINPSHQTANELISQLARQ